MAKFYEGVILSSLTLGSLYDSILVDVPKTKGKRMHFQPSNAFFPCVCLLCFLKTD